MSHEIADKLRIAILQGKLKPGDTLPPEPKLASAFDAGRNPIREAVSKLLSEGLLRIARGKGTRIRNWREEGSFDLVLDVLRMHAKTPQAAEVVTQLLWLRRALYTQLPSLLPRPLTELTSVVSATWNIRVGNHFGYGWTDLPALLPSEERALTAFAEATGNLPAIMLAHAIRRMLGAVSRLGERVPLPDALERFKLLATEPTVQLLEELCRLREQTYVQLMTATEPSESDVAART